MKHTLIVMIGASGIGKSYLAKYIQDTHDDCVIVSRDKIRFAMLHDDDDYFEYENEVERNFYSAITTMLRTHKYVIADATHLTVKSRRKLFNNITLPSGTHVIGVCIEAPLSIALRQNAMREGRARVPEKAIRRMYKYKVSPQEGEPFDELIFISREHDLAIGSKSAKLESAFNKLKEI